MCTDFPFCFKHRKRPHTLGLCSQLYKKSSRSLGRRKGKEMVSHSKPASTPRHLNLVFATLCLDETNYLLYTNVAVHDTQAYSQALCTENTALYWYEFLICSLQHCLHVTHKNIPQKDRTLHLIYFWSPERPYLLGLLKAEGWIETSKLGLNFFSLKAILLATNIEKKKKKKLKAETSQKGAEQGAMHIMNKSFISLMLQSPVKGA